MIRLFLRSKIDRARVTGTDGTADTSITLDEHLMNAAGLVPFERVEIYGVPSGRGFTTHVVAATAGSGALIMNGAAARLAAPGDEITIACYCMLHDGQVLDHRPKLVHVDENNRVVILDEQRVTP